jgi:hypothetical protein
MNDLLRTQRVTAGKVKLRPNDAHVDARVRLSRTKDGFLHSSP